MGRDCNKIKSYKKPRKKPKPCRKTFIYLFFAIYIIVKRLMPPKRFIYESCYVFSTEFFVRERNAGDYEPKGKHHDLQK
ncbi:hypothetical protein WN944_006509 [Citrus x changshan-huyou]|uniref:Uncharacterized protein n=1 Tax=Citrus x changshan-huyou TaxID=2935761 RepID=A0AAP0QTB1_9ROSI